MGFSVEKITSRQNETVKKTVHVRLNPSAEEFVVEGSKFVLDLNPECIKRIFVVRPEKFSDFLNKLSSVPIYEVPESVMDKISGVNGKQEICAVVKKINGKRPNKLILLDGVQDPGNAGTIIRTAAAFGFGCIFSEDSVNPFSEKTTRSSAGTVISTYIKKTNLVTETEKLKSEGFFVISSELDEKARKLKEFDLSTAKIAVIVGNEGNGVSSVVSATADEKLYIPINNVESLNVAVAASIIMHSFSEV